MHEPLPLDPAELERHRSFLRALARQLVRGEAAAEDLVQDAFVRALERPPDSALALRAWLARVTQRLALNRLRAERRTTLRERGVARAEAVPPHDEALASLELQERLVAAVKALAEPYRTTLWLRFHEELATGAIAERQATTKKTIESRLTRGLALLRGELDRQAGGDRRQWLSAVAGLARGERVAWFVPLGVGAMKKVVVALCVLFVLALGWRFVASGPRSAPGAALGQGAPRLAEDAVPVAREAGEAERAALSPESLPLSAPVLTSLLIRVRWAEDGAPAPGIGVIVRPAMDPRGARAVLFVASDADGLVRVAPIHPGSVRIEADRGGAETVEVAEGRETEATFELAPGLELEGTVTDRSGAPLADAEVLLVAEEHDWLAPRVVAHTAANGSYRVRGVSPEFSVTARARSLAPAALRPLRGRSGRARVDFVLGEEGVGLRGLVRDAEGVPVAGALVAVGDNGGYYEGDPERPGTYLAARGLRVERTDADGRFFASGVLRGYGLAVAVQADGHPIAVANVSDAEAAVSFVELTLAPPATLGGVVRTASGAPLAGVSAKTIVCDGAEADEIPFALPEATSDGEGRYRLELLPRRCALRLDPPADAAAAPTLVALELAPGETRRDLVLAADDALRGRVVMPPGTAFEGWYVYVHELQGVVRVRRAPVAADGRFEVPDCSSPPYRLDLYAAAERPVLRRDDVGPGEEVVLVPPALASLRGEFVDEAGLLPDGARPEIRLEFREYDALAPSWVDGARFAFDSLSAGRYRLTFWHAGRTLFSRTVDVAPGQSLDLGRIASAAPGSLALTLEPEPSGGIEGRVLDASFVTVAQLELVDGRLGVAALPPGDWYLELETAGVAQLCAPFTIRAGERTELALALVPGVERSLALRTGERAWGTLHVELRDSTGRLVLARWIRRAYWPAAGAEPSLLARLPVGTFTLEATSDTGLSAHASFDVPALVPQDAPLAFELR